MKLALYLLMIFGLSSSTFAVDINTATEEELARELWGIGKVKAQRIVEYREQIGEFRSIEQLTKVYGIGPKTLERNRDKIEIQGGNESTISPPFSLPQKEEEALSVEKQKSFDNKIPSSIPFVQKREMETENASQTSISSIQRDTSDLDLSPDVEKTPRPLSYFLWDALIIIPLFVICLLIFIAAWLKKKITDQPILREHLVNTTFTCSSCGKNGNVQNHFYEGHLSEQNVDSDLPSGWICIPNWLGQPCDYCIDCSQKIYPKKKSRVNNSLIF